MYINTSKQNYHQMSTFESAKKLFSDKKYIEAKSKFLECLDEKNNIPLSIANLLEISKILNTPERENEQKNLIALLAHYYQSFC